MKKAWLRLIDLVQKLKDRLPKSPVKRSLVLTLLGLALFVAGASSFLFIGAIAGSTVLSIVLGLGCVIAAIVFVNKGDPSKLPKAQCWACGHALEAPADKTEKKES